MIVVEGGSLIGSPAVGVVVPTFKHPLLLVEALNSLKAQKTSFEVVWVIVVDGCPMQETADICEIFAAASPNLHLIVKANAGPSSARNAGIEFLLATYDGVQAIFFLDADNRLQPRALQLAFEALASGPPNAGWVYSDIDTFGIRWSGNYGIPYSRMLHVTHQNFCDTGCLVSRKVFNAGVRFNEDERSGYEDWEFWLQCLAKGFVGHPARFGLAYRQRPDSRNKENQRNEAAIRAYVLDRHKEVASFGTLSRWEHEDHPRFALHDGQRVGLFTDPRHRDRSIDTELFVEQFWSHQRLPDHVDMPPYVAAGDPGALQRLDDARLLNNAFYLGMRAAEHANFAVLIIEDGLDGFGVSIDDDIDGVALQRACLVMCTARIFREVALDSHDHWVNSLMSDYPQPTLRCVTIRIPGAVAQADGRAVREILGLVAAVRNSPYRPPSQGPRWEGRAPIMPGRDRYYRHLCGFFGVQDLICQLRTDRFEVGIVLPIATFGGAEKVAYALARTLRACGARTHLFVLGEARQKDISAFRDAFDTRHFLDVDYPIWGGGMRSGGQEFFSADDPALQERTVKGLLLGLDLVINCNSAPLNAMVGELKRTGVIAATYLHVTDKSELGRLVGHPYLTVAFEHSYALILTCSQMLRRELHGLGVPAEKIIAIPNTAALDVTDADRARAHRRRRGPRGPKPLRLLSISRLDRQKGVERLLGVLRELRRRNAPVDCRVIGSALLDEGGDWGSRFAPLGIMLEPPVYATSELLDAYLWADVLLLPSRWEGAPLVIPESQTMGCIPIATEVGAVGELIDQGRDGILVADGDDLQVVADYLECIEALLSDDAWRQELALAGMARLETASWSKNFEPLLEWLQQRFPQRFASAPEYRAGSIETVHDLMRSRV